FPYLSSVGRYVCCFSLHDALPIYRGKILSRRERLSFHRGGDFSEIWLGSFLGACSRHGRTLSQARKRNGADFSRRWPRLAATFPRFGSNEDPRVRDEQLSLLFSCQA